MKDSAQISNLPSSKPGTSQSNKRKMKLQNQSVSPNPNSIDILENDIIQLQLQKKNIWEDNVTKPPSALAKKRNNYQNTNQSNQGQSDPYNPTINQQGLASRKGSRPVSQGTTKATQFYKKQNEDLDTPLEDFGLEQKQQNTVKNSKRSTGLSFYHNDSPRGLSSTKTKLLENVAKQNVVDYPNKIEGPTPKVWHPKMEEYQTKGDEWNQNIQFSKQDEMIKQLEKQKQFREKTRQTFLENFKKNLNADIKQKQNTSFQIQLSSLNTTKEEGALIKIISKEEQLNTQENQISLAKENNTQQIANLNATVGSLQRYPRLNSAISRCGNTLQTSLQQESFNQQNETRRKRVMSQQEYGINYDYNIRAIGTKGMFALEEQSRNNNALASYAYNIDSNENKNQQICKVGSLLRSIQSAKEAKKSIENINGDIININLTNQKLIQSVNSGEFNGSNKLIATQSQFPYRVSKTRPQTSNPIDIVKANTSKRQSPKRDSFSIEQNSLKPIPYNSDTDRKIQSSLSNSLQNTKKCNYQVLNSTDQNIMAELDHFDEKMEENEKMKKIYNKMHHQSKGFCGITKKENEMLITVEGFRKVRAKKSLPSYPYCLSFDPF